MSSTTQHNSARGPTPTRSPAPGVVSVQPNYSAFPGFGSSSQPTSQFSTSQLSLHQQQQALPKPATQSTVDPFAALTSPVRYSTPQQNLSQSSGPSSLFDFGQPAAAPAQTQVPAANDDDEWAFSSALPEANGLPSSNDLTVTEATVKIDLRASRQSPSDTIIRLDLKFSSKVAQPVTELTFQAAVTKVAISRPIFTQTC
jgi:ADP-ribosylation factor-binding protein GGA